MPGRKSMLAVRFFCISESVAGQPAFGAKHSDTVHEIDRDRLGYAFALTGFRRFSRRILRYT